MLSEFNRAAALDKRAVWGWADLRKNKQLGRKYGVAHVHSVWMAANVCGQVEACNWDLEKDIRVFRDGIPEPWYAAVEQ